MVGWWWVVVVVVVVVVVLVVAAVVVGLKQTMSPEPLPGCRQLCRRLCGRDGVNSSLSRWLVSLGASTLVLFS